MLDHLSFVLAHPRGRPCVSSKPQSCAPNKGSLSVVAGCASNQGVLAIFKTWIQQKSNNTNQWLVSRFLARFWVTRHCLLLTLLSQSRPRCRQASTVTLANTPPARTHKRSTALRASNSVASDAPPPGGNTSETLGNK